MITHLLSFFNKYKINIRKFFRTRKKAARFKTRSPSFPFHYSALFYSVRRRIETVVFILCSPLRKILSDGASGLSKSCTFCIKKYPGGEQRSNGFCPPPDGWPAAQTACSLAAQGKQMLLCSACFPYALATSYRPCRRLRASGVRVL